jgi:hypothetical protein
MKSKRIFLWELYTEFIYLGHRQRGWRLVVPTTHKNSQWENSTPPANACARQQEKEGKIQK